MKLSMTAAWCLWLEQIRDSINLRGVDLREQQGQTLFHELDADLKPVGDPTFWIGTSGADMLNPFSWVPVRIRDTDGRPEVLVKIELAIRLVKG